ncbi:MAG: hypothetical protein MZW92_48605 [Comamonadaceae bacterium]|nr:hypothetical protein [Comamonadaceae bacterium]
MQHREPAGVLPAVLPAGQRRAARWPASSTRQDARADRRDASARSRGRTRTLPALWTVEPTQDGERSFVVRRKGDVQIVLVGLPDPVGLQPDSATALGVGGRRSSATRPTAGCTRNWCETGMAAQVFGWPLLRRDPGLMVFGAVVKKGEPVEPRARRLIEIVEASFAQQAPTDGGDDAHARRTTRPASSATLADPQQFGVALSEYIAARRLAAVLPRARPASRRSTPRRSPRRRRATSAATTAPWACSCPRTTPQRAEIPAAAAGGGGAEGLQAAAATWPPARRSSRRRTTSTRAPASLRGRRAEGRAAAEEEPRRDGQRADPACAGATSSSLHGQGGGRIADRRDARARHEQAARAQQIADEIDAAEDRRAGAARLPDRRAPTSPRRCAWRRTCCASRASRPSEFEQLQARDDHRPAVAAVRPRGARRATRWRRTSTPIRRATRALHRRSRSGSRRSKRPRCERRQALPRRLLRHGARRDRDRRRLRRQGGRGAAAASCSPAGRRRRRTRAIAARAARDRAAQRLVVDHAGQGERVLSARGSNLALRDDDADYAAAGCWPTTSSAAAARLSNRLIERAAPAATACRYGAGSGLSASAAATARATLAASAAIVAPQNVAQLEAAVREETRPRAAATASPTKEVADARSGHAAGARC